MMIADEAIREVFNNPVHCREYCGELDKNYRMEVLDTDGDILDAGGTMHFKNAVVQLSPGLVGQLDAATGFNKVWTETVKSPRWLDREDEGGPDINIERQKFLAANPRKVRLLAFDDPKSGELVPLALTPVSKIPLKPTHLATWTSIAAAHHGLHVETLHPDLWRRLDLRMSPTDKAMVVDAKVGDVVNRHIAISYTPEARRDFSARSELERLICTNLSTILESTNNMAVNVRADFGVARNKVDKFIAGQVLAMKKVEGTIRLLKSQRANRPEQYLGRWLEREKVGAQWRLLIVQEFSEAYDSSDHYSAFNAITSSRHRKKELEPSDVDYLGRLAGQYLTQHAASLGAPLLLEATH